MNSFGGKLFNRDRMLFESGELKTDVSNLYFFFTIIN